MGNELRGDPVTRSHTTSALARREQALLAQGRDLVLLLDGRGVIIDVFGPPVILGNVPTSVQGRLGLDLVHPDDLGRLLDGLEAARAGDRAQQVLRFRVNLGNATRWVEGTRSDLLDHPDVGAIVWNIRDIQDELEAAARLAASEEGLRALFDSDVVAQALTDESGSVVAANAALCAMVGISPAEALERSVLDFWVPADPFLRTIESLADVSEHEVKLVGACIRADGASLPVEVTVRRLRNMAPSRFLVQVADVTDREAARQALHRTEQQLAAVIAHAPLILGTYDLDGVIDYWGGQALARVPRVENLRGANVFEVFAGMHAELARARQALGGIEGSGTIEVGGTVWDVHHRPRRDAAGAVTGGVVMAIDNTDRSLAEAATRTSEQRLHSLLTRTSDVIAVEGADGGLRYVSPSAAHVFGRSPEELLGRRLIDLVAPADHRVLGDARDRWTNGGATTVEVRLAMGAGPDRSFEVHAANHLDDPVITGIVLTFRDVTERKMAEQRALLASTHDDLTGLPNRKMLAGAAGGLLRRSGGAALLAVDVDGFALVNATYGDAVGDRVLRVVADQLVDAAPDPGLVYRIGGDEFVVYVTTPAAGGVEALAVAAAERLVAAVAGNVAVEVDGSPISLSVSVGIAVVGGGDDLTGLLQRASAAVRTAKDEGDGGGVEVFGTKLAAIAKRQFLVESELRGAISRGELTLRYQPQIDMTSGALVGVESLVRWNHPRLGLLPPSEFLPIAEQSRLIVDVGRWVLREACAQAARWERAWPERRLVVACNLSARHLLDPRLVGDLQAALSSSGVTPARLRLEITETAVMTDADVAVETLRALKATGVKLSIDDFGTGWSSLSYLQLLPVDELKVDRTFVSAIGTDGGHTVIIDSIVSLARSLGLRVVAEGVETRQQRDTLVQMGVVEAQGFLWSRAVSVQAIDQLLGFAFPFVGVRLGGRGVREVVDPLTEVDAIVRNARAASAVVSTVADLARLDDGTLPLELAAVDLNVLVAELAEDLQRTNPHPLVVRGTAAPAVVDVDAVRLRQIVWNLLANAVRFSGCDDPVELVVERRPNGGVALLVRDLGPGIEAADGARMFRRYSRLSGPRSGTGLGLCLGYQLAVAHGGDLRYRRRQPRGSEFELLLPGAQAASAPA